MVIAAIPDVPEARAIGRDDEEACEQALGALEAVLETYTRKAAPSRSRARQVVSRSPRRNTSSPSPKPDPRRYSHSGGPSGAAVFASNQSAIATVFSSV